MFITVFLVSFVAAALGAFPVNTLGSVEILYHNDNTCVDNGHINTVRHFQWNPTFATNDGCVPYSPECLFYGSSDSVQFYTRRLCQATRPSYRNRVFIYQENYWSQSTCPVPTASVTSGTNYQGMYAPNSECVFNHLGLARAGTQFPQRYVKVVCQANVLTWITCDDNLCSSNCISGSAPANNDQCTSEGQGSSSGGNIKFYYRYYCPNVQTTTIPPSSLMTTSPSTTTTSGWAGIYQVTSTCDTSSCCCLTGEVSVTQAGSTVHARGSLTGACGSTSTGTPLFFTIDLDTSTASSASFIFFGQPFTGSLSGNVLSLTNVNFPQCSATAVRSSFASIIGPSVFLMALIGIFLVMV